MGKLKGRIVAIEKIQNREVCISQGIKKYDQYRYSGYSGGNGTYVTGSEYLGTSLNVKIFVYDIEKLLNFDVYENILSISGKKKISSKMLAEIEANVGRKVNLHTDDGLNFKFKPSELLS